MNKKINYESWAKKLIFSEHEICDPPTDACIDFRCEILVGLIQFIVAQKGITNIALFFLYIVGGHYSYNLEYVSFPSKTSEYFKFIFENP